MKRTTPPKLTFKAFTIIEVLVALWIITVAVLGPLTSALNSSANTRDSKNIVVAAYLAQESFELLRFERDTIFLRCISNDATCTAVALPIPATDFEHGHEAAWRLFKDVLANGSSTDSCFVNQNANGCTYDVEGFLNSPTSNPVIYNSNIALCPFLYRDDREQKGTASSSPTDGMYLCNNHGLPFTSTTFKRVVKVTSIPTIQPNIPGSYDEIYNDDLRIVVEVSYSKSNSLTKKVSSVDFMRARL